MGPRTLVAEPDERVSGPTSFGAIDRPLTDRQMRELRAISTRAAISRTSFSNHYEYGDLKANPRDLLVNYFDASLYFAQLVVPRSRVPVPEGRRGCESPPPLRGGPHARHSDRRHERYRRHLGRERWGDFRYRGRWRADWLSSLAGLRADIAGGDERAPVCGMVAGCPMRRDR